jgi:ferredoxin
LKNRYLKNVATLAFNTEKCTGCGMCTEVCPHNVWAIQSGKASIAAKDRCMECGACEKNCAFGAVTVKAGVGCASAVIKGWLTGSEPSCDCSGGSSCC